MAERLARLTGLSVDYVEDADLRPVIYRFTKELLRDEGKTVGRLDSRFTGYDRQDVGDTAEYDPSYAAIQGSFTATLNEYVRDELGFDADLDYEILGGRIEHWTAPEGQYVNVAEDLRHAMTQNPALKIHVANGYYDLATPYFATRYTFDHMELPEALRKNVSMSYYEAGHMMYIRAAELARLKETLAGFIQDSDGTTGSAGGSDPSSERHRGRGASFSPGWKGSRWGRSSYSSSSPSSFSVRLSTRRRISWRSSRQAAAASSSPPASPRLPSGPGRAPPRGVSMRSARSSFWRRRAPMVSVASWTVRSRCSSQSSLTMLPPRARTAPRGRRPGRSAPR